MTPSTSTTHLFAPWAVGFLFVFVEEAQMICWYRPNGMESNMMVVASVRRDEYQ